ncbi:MAG: hypothetical protein LBS25_09575 [Candidatus Symbiothrix sp.]|jgi:hypothetical protein|nr:hypothetical protein [Candidatus Symbiothrix sp.]
MNTQIKTAIYWLLLGVCFLTHTLFHIYGLFYGVDIRLPDTTGSEVPLFDQVFNTVIFTLTFLIALLSVNLSGRGFRWFSLVWSVLFLLLNLAHLAEAAFVEKFDLSQVCLLSFVLVVNGMLIVTLWKSLRPASKSV